MAALRRRPSEGQPLATEDSQEARIFDYYQNNPEAVQELQAPIFEEKVVDFIVEMAQVTDKTVSVEELTAEPTETEG